jgi:phosphopentomutase
LILAQNKEDPMAFRRIVWIVLDSVGVGAMPDWRAYLDPAPGDTLGHVAARRPLQLANFQRLGLANLHPIPHLAALPHPAGSYGRATLASPGKDTTTGHWEMAGILLRKPFPLYPQGFPSDLMAEFERRIGRATLGNIPASGTEIIARLGAEHMATGRPIVYTSADSVFQIAAHEEVIALPELYRMCEIARELLTGPHEVGRVIARPFVGTPGAFTRTSNRHDYAVAPPAGMLLDRLAAARVPVWSVGKIADIFLGRGIARSFKTKEDSDGMAQTLAALRELDRGLVWVILVDFDMLYGHRNDPEGYARALEAVDAWLPQLQQALGVDDLALFTADHGCDPTTPGTDHTREYTPLIAWSRSSQSGVDLGLRASLADIGATVADNFGVTSPAGASFLDAIVA